MDRITHTQKIGHSLAIAFRAPPKGCIHHTDRGSQYYSHDDQNILPRHGFKVSPSHPCGYALLGQWMSGKGNCSDNAAVETFFKTIKAEHAGRLKWPSSITSGSTITRTANTHH
jgi:putative transposase